MLYEMMAEKMPEWMIYTIGGSCGFLITLLLMWKPFGFLPRDGGKRVETPDGKIVVINENSNGKVTGIGLVFVIVFLLISVLFLPLNTEFLIYIGLMFLMMLTGYLDDAAAAPWGELVKGVLDLVLSVGAAITFVSFNSTDVILFGNTIHMPVWLYAVLGVILVWVSINVTNCSDGVDGLCGSVSIVTMVAYFLLFRTEMPDFAWMGILMSAVLAGYLVFNWNPSKVLMGDAGSRTIGFLLALLAMQSGHPFIFLLMSLVFIFDGGMGLIKVSLIRFLKIKAFPNVIFPFHDHMRKNMGVPIRLIPVIFAMVQIVCCAIAAIII